MSSQKSFWKKYEKPIVILVTLLIIYIIVIFNQKINFILGNELAVYLEPTQKSFSLNYGNKTSADFDVSVLNTAQCKTSCNYSFVDKSRNITVDYGSFELRGEQHFKRAYELSAGKLGKGQNIYTFDVTCRSVRSLLCLTSSPEKVRSSFVTVNYDLTEQEKQLREKLRKSITAFLLLLAETDIENQKINQKYFELAHKVNLKNISSKKLDINDDYDSLAIAAENLRSIWFTENFTRLDSEFNESFYIRANAITKSIVQLGNDINHIVELHNAILEELSTIKARLRNNEIIAEIVEDEEIGYDSYSNIRNFNMIASDISNNTFSNYTEVKGQVSGLKSRINLLENKSRNISAQAFFSMAYAIEYEKQFLCSLRGDCMENVTLNDIFGRTGQFIAGFPDSDVILKACGDIAALGDEHAKMRQDSNKIIELRNLSFPEDGSFIGLVQDFRDNLARKINNSHYDSLEELKMKNTTPEEIIRLAEKMLAKNKTGAKGLAHNESINLSLYLLSKIDASQQTTKLSEKCLGLNKSLINNFGLNKIDTNITYKIIDKIDTTLPDAQPVCCVFGECRACCSGESCRNDPSTYPVVFIHGHAVSKSNSPEFSFDSFNKLQSKLEEDGYLNAGIVSLHSKSEYVEEGTWSFSGKPVSVKVSYYFDVLRKEDEYVIVPTKSESIDTYAVRLKELIDIIMQRTDKPKVNIVAHSMGGLVARRYIQIFRDDNVDKLIMIATPNKGIKGAAANYCGVIGENRECRDMVQGSLFLSKLNDPSAQPGKVRLYSIIGKGCKMDGNDGDGIVLAENAELDNARLYYVEGSCGGLLGEVLHTELLNTGKYPEVYEIVRDYLKE